MTATSFPDASFGLVLDKGGLDALMGDGDPGSLAAGEKLLREVDRLLRPGDGAYVCVTLAQEHVLGAHRSCAPAARCTHSQGCSPNGPLAALRIVR